jgi:hypothetical protein
VRCGAARPPRGGCGRSQAVPAVGAWWAARASVMRGDCVSRRDLAAAAAAAAAAARIASGRREVRWIQAGCRDGWRAVWSACCRTTRGRCREAAARRPRWALTASAARRQPTGGMFLRSSAANLRVIRRRIASLVSSAGPTGCAVHMQTSTSRRTRRVSRAKIKALYNRVDTALVRAVHTVEGSPSPPVIRGHRGHVSCIVHPGAAPEISRSMIHVHHMPLSGGMLVCRPRPAWAVRRRTPRRVSLLPEPDR